MSHIEQLTKYVGNFIDELTHQGVIHAVISPGSRSTPLAMMLTEHKDIKEWILVDERSASFFALGLARATNTPVVLVCTSGTAAANYYPAVIEAYEQRIPLIVLTADRPHELRDTGASQTMNQTRLYGDFTKWFHDMALPEATDVMLQYVRSKAARAYTESMSIGNMGPIQVNFPFREPLIPDFSLANIWGRRGKRHITTYAGDNVLEAYALEQVMEQLQGKKQGLIVCGPQFDESLAPAMVRLADHLQIPILADPLAQLRAYTHDKTNIIDGFDTILFTENMREKLAPEYIIRFGAMPVSKRYLHYLNENRHIDHFIVEKKSGYREPTSSEATFIFAEEKQFCNSLCEKIPKEDENGAWLAMWQECNEIAQKHAKQHAKEVLTEGNAVGTLFASLPENSGVFVGNSMPIRDADTFFTNTNKTVKVYGNRGVSGIEGIVSTALGIAASGEHDHVTLVIGDLSFYHDLNGLFASKKYQIPLTILLINNDGGGIFSFLPQANGVNHFERLFGTPMKLDFTHAAALYDAHYKQVTDASTLQSELESSYERTGLYLIEVQTDREENVLAHKKLWEKAQEELGALWK